MPKKKEEVEVKKPEPEVRLVTNSQLINFKLDTLAARQEEVMKKLEELLILAKE